MYLVSPHQINHFHIVHLKICLKYINETSNVIMQFFIINLFIKYYYPILNIFEWKTIISNESYFALVAMKIKFLFCSAKIHLLICLKKNLWFFKYYQCQLNIQHFENNIIEIHEFYNIDSIRNVGVILFSVNISKNSILNRKIM